ncbi:hypothetical protein DdX_22407 [Ditylenchus destructor]|uniref:Uncharacterized protein n=1 Tax=Ditylenchus destructor TaxID=166010 RepID=A0AAD4QSI6_9BILA|nr:hypothetical protein DdX_22407 [Ditylenchus destructor]
MSISGAKLAIAIVAILVIGSCSARFIGFMDFGGRAEIYVEAGNQTEVCEFCKRIVANWDQYRPPKSTPEELAAFIKNTLCPHVKPGGLDEQLCKAVAGKEDIFAKAYFDHQKDHKVNPTTKQMRTELQNNEALYNDAKFMSKLNAMNDNYKLIKRLLDALQDMESLHNIPKINKTLQSAFNFTRVDVNFENIYLRLIERIHQPGSWRAQSGVGCKTPSKPPFSAIWCPNDSILPSCPSFKQRSMAEKQRYG